MNKDLIIFIQAEELVEKLSRTDAELLQRQYDAEQVRKKITKLVEKFGKLSISIKILTETRHEAAQKIADYKHHLIKEDK